MFKKRHVKNGESLFNHHDKDRKPHHLDGRRSSVVRVIRGDGCASEWKVGTVRDFSFRSKFGFIRPEDGGDEVYVNIVAVEQSGIRRFETGVRVEFRQVEFEPGKWRAVELRLIRNDRRRELPAECKNQHRDSNVENKERSATSARDGWVPAIIRWFHTEKKYGFVSLANGSEAFLHIRELERAPGISVHSRNEGLAVKVKVGPGKKDPNKLRVLAISLT
ncbi:MAG: cold shock domain-containing protein [Candidatus Pacebacteria bacterium]|nr:cold shock domain-containing protein [Candidatus Paceibacterota bacterium]